MRSEGNALKLENQHLVSPSRQCSSTQIDMGKDILAKENVTLDYTPTFQTWLQLIFTCSNDRSALEGTELL